MNRNTLEVQYGVHRFRDAPDGPLRPLLAPSLRIDGEPMLDRFTLDLRELVASTHRDGEFWLFICGCGTPGCSGIENAVEILHLPTEVLWRLPYPVRQPGGNDPVRREYLFERHAYFGIVDATLAEAKGIADRFHGDVDLGPYGFEVKELGALAVGRLLD